MKILLIDIDSKIPNLALKKIEKYHTDKGDEIIWNMPIFRNVVDKIYVSCIFKKNRDKCREWENDPKVLVGGSGFDLKTVLPNEIEAVKPHINLGFTTRGCIRHCGFCIVPEKEGKIRPVGDLLDLWDGKAKDVVLMDNNILALPEHFKMICKQARDNKIRADFNQGLDHRLLTNEICKELTSISHIEYRFAFDNLHSEKTVLRAIEILRKHGINRCNWYVLVGYNTTINEDLYRLNLLRSHNQNAYVQRYTQDKKYIPLARWANQHHIFRGMTWEQFISRDENKRYFPDYRRGK